MKSKVSTFNGFESGVDFNNLPVSLVGNSDGNDICPSFYFNVEGEFYLLWIDHQDKNEREDPDAFRYIVERAINEGNDEHPEIYSDSRVGDLLQTDDKNELTNFIVGLTEKVNSK